MAKMIKLRMNVSIAGTLPSGEVFGYQPTQVVLVEAELAQKWISVGHAERADKEEPITETAALSSNDFLEHDPRLVHRLRGMVIA